ncbi:hypothetical protein CDL15_Pgr015009 [Punica granatum]|uniref:Uncharacterized protein n=1 Tax=Punica granatum TaxID=22663 RepID=A0A218X0L9_PUNGR|nr:hypothetical protein CDL15_Pgr015009 [Punica granatum]PKI47839.1 hypothetical protein CRG98_031800 [Punica granatum]
MINPITILLGRVLRLDSRGSSRESRRRVSLGRIGQAQIFKAIEGQDEGKFGFFGPKPSGAGLWRPRRWCVVAATGREGRECRKRQMTEW